MTDTNGWKRVRQALSIAVVALLVVSGVGPFASFGGMINNDHGGEASASPDSDVVYIGGSDNDVEAIYADNGSNVWTFSGHSDSVKGVVQSPNGDVVYSASIDGTAKAIYASNGTEKWSYSGLGNLWSVAASPNGEYIFVGDGDGDVAALDPSDGSEIRSASPHGNRVTDIAVGADSVYYFTSSNDGTLDSRYVENGSSVCGYSHPNSVYGVGAGPDGEWFYSAPNEGIVTKLGATNCSSDWTYDAGQDVNDVAIDSDGDRAYVATYGYQTGDLVALDDSDGSKQWSYTGQGNDVEKVSTSPSGDTIYSASRDGTIASVDTGGSENWKTSKAGSLTAVSGGGDISAKFKLSGQVNDSSSNAIEDASVDVVDASSGDTKASTTTDSTGYYEVSVLSGTYDVTASKSSDSKTETVTVSSATTLDFCLGCGGSSGYTQEFHLNDYADTFDDATLSVSEEVNDDDQSGYIAPKDTEDWNTVAETSFNHNDNAFVDSLEDGALYRLKVTDADSEYTEVGWEADPDRGPYNITVGEAGSSPTPTENGTNDSGGELEVVECGPNNEKLCIKYRGDEVDRINANVTDGDGNPVYKINRSFDRNKSYIRWVVNKTLGNNSTDPGDYEIDFNGTYGNGSWWNGSAGAGDDVQVYPNGSTDTDAGGLFGGGGGGGGGGIVPADSGGGAPVWLTAIPAVAAIGYAVYRQRSGGLT
ncbi:PQQ-binding-like beta-propeller repeat protein [Natronomonas marina]|uniref:outer membrane protein assembly factor BamB family protein n=1 Tax=Natronomonas marina TaxID=2961939 RepID=UPI0020C9DD58|nr:PQQ-binding-like beta-propeller repeat protein [Natronomonas marina]